MRKMLVTLTFIMMIVLTGCGKDEVSYNFKSRKDDYYISESKRVIIEYKTNSVGEMIELNIDRLLTIEEMVYFNTNIDFDYVLEGYAGDIYESAGFLCTKYDNFSVPTNIEVGNTKFKYNRTDCEYQEVDRDNIYKTGSYAQVLSLKETIDVSKKILISIVVFDEDSAEKFIEIQKLPHTAELLGVYSIPINSDKDGFGTSGVYYYYKDMAIYEQLYLKNQLNETTLEVINGIPTDINLLDLNSISELKPLIANFYIIYEEESTAMIELEGIIGNFEVSTGESDDE